MHRRATVSFGATTGGCPYKTASQQGQTPVSAPTKQGGNHRGLPLQSSVPVGADPRVCLHSHVEIVSRRHLLQSPKNHLDSLFVPGLVGDDVFQVVHQPEVAELLGLLASLQIAGDGLLFGAMHIQ